MIGIIGAMEEEIKALKKYMTDISQSQVNDCVFYQGKINQKDIVLTLSGIGKVNAAVSTSLLLTNYPIEYVINIGSAGGLADNQKIGDIVVGEKVANHDFDLRAFNRQPGEIPDLGTCFSCDDKLIAKANNYLNQHQYTVHQGLIVSGDQFIWQKNQVEMIHNNFPKALACDMEAGAIGQTCYKFNIPFIVIRSLSDIYNREESQHIQFEKFISKASLNSAKMCVALINE